MIYERISAWIILCHWCTWKAKLGMSGNLVTVLIWSLILFNTTEKQETKTTATIASQPVVYRQLLLHKDNLLYFTEIQMWRCCYFPTSTLTDTVTLLRERIGRTTDHILGYGSVCAVLVCLQGNCCSVGNTWDCHTIQLGKLQCNHFL
jgi:hypothetical protein